MGVNVMINDKRRRPSSFNANYVPTFLLSCDTIGSSGVLCVVKCIYNRDP